MATDEDWKNGGFGLYVHWPFCASKCPYCDFNSHVAASVDHDDWSTALVREVDLYGEKTQNRVLNSIFFGGGTPSLMSAETMKAVINAAKSHWNFANDIEITFEANPTSVEIEKFQAFREAGANRVSIGVQSFDAQSLRNLGRLHTAEQGREAIEIARNVFDRYSFDLIYARQHQNLTQWENELSHALSLDPTHLSLYQLTIEQGTAFGDRYNAGKLDGLPNDGLGAELYQLTQSLCVEAELAAYEVSNHARLGSESRHNLIYWRYGDYLGIGPGAHGRLTQNGQKTGIFNQSSPNAWLKSVLSGTRDHISEEHLDQTAQTIEYLLMSLRLGEGCDLDRLDAKTAISQPALRQLSEDGYIIQEGQTLKTTAKGRPLLNTILGKLIA